MQVIVSIDIKQLLTWWLIFKTLTDL